MKMKDITKEDMKKMIDKIKLFFGLLTVLIVMIFVVGAFYLISLSKETNVDMSTYTARKEELLLEQQKIQNLIVELNATLANEVDANKKLTQRLQLIDNQINSITNETIPSTPIVTAPPTAPPAQIPAAPTVRRITRAS